MLVPIARLARVITVQALMVPARDLRRASALSDAIPLFVDFDVVPYPSRGRITGYFQKEAELLEQLSPADVMSSDTPVLDLPGLFSRRPFYFIIEGTDVVGFVHYSDLNKPPARAPFFTLIEVVERHISHALADRITSEEVRAITDSGRYSRLAKELKKRKRNNVDLGWIAVLSFRDMLCLSQRHSLTRLSDQDIKLLAGFRNNVAHPNNDMIDRYADVRHISQASSLLQAIAKSA